MLLLGILLFFFLPLQSRADCGQIKKVNIENFMAGDGARISKAGLWPWLAPLFYDGQYICGSTIISKLHLISAAHCVFGEINSYRTVLGIHNLNSDFANVSRAFSTVYTHENYNGSLRGYKSKNDIAIFKLKEKILFTDFIQPICLPYFHTETVNVDGFVVGHGFNEINQTQMIAKYAMMSSVDKSFCIFNHTDHHKGVSEKSFCALSYKASACRGDSGGGFYYRDPITHRFSLYGIVSQGMTSGICHPGDFSVFVNVPDYLNWILEKLKICYLYEKCLQLTDLDPCLSVNCGKFAKCSIFYNRTSCSCLPNHYGTPPNCKKYCESNSDCSQFKICLINGLCVDTCHYYSCDANQKCVPKTNHQYSCQYTDAYLASLKRIEEEKERTNNAMREANIYQCIFEILHSNIDSAVKIFKELNDDDLIERIVKEVYSKNVDNVENILKFSRGLPYIEQLSKAYETLFNKMKEKGQLKSYHITMLAYRIHEAMNMPNYPKLSQKHLNIFENIKNSFSTGIKSLFWSSELRLKNVEYNEYLYAAGSHFIYDSDRRRVFTWRPRNRISNGVWEIIPVNDGRYFKIKNKLEQECLYAVGEHYLYDPDRRQVFTWIPNNVHNSKFEWELSPAGSGDYFTIKNRNYQEYLYAVGDSMAYDKERRRVFTWIPGNEMNEKFYWKIE